MRKTILVLAFLMLGCGGDEATVQFRIPAEDQMLREELTVRAAAGDWALVVPGADMGTATGSGPEFSTPGHGTLTVIALVGAENRPLREVGGVELDLKAGWRWTLDFSRGTEDPIDNCIGCGGSASFALPSRENEAGPDSLFVVWTQVRHDQQDLVY